MSVISAYKAYACIETLPYSRHQFNLTFIICIKDPKRDSVRRLQSTKILLVPLKCEIIFGTL